MVDVVALRKQREKDLEEDRKAVHLYAEWVRKTPNKIWSQQQADFFKSVYGAINANWRASRKKK